MFRPLLAVVALSALTAAAEEPGAGCEQRLLERSACAKEYCAMASPLAAVRLEALFPGVDSVENRAAIEKNCREALEEQRRDEATRARACAPAVDPRPLEQFLDAMDQCQAQSACTAKVACLKPLLDRPFTPKEPKTRMVVPGHSR